jgi:hypothetical protein
MQELGTNLDWTEALTFWKPENDALLHFQLYRWSGAC